MAEDPEGAEEILTDPDELVWRNAHPDFYDEGSNSLTSQVFRATPKDEKKPSGARETKATASQHFDEFTTVLKLKSVGVWAVSVAEVEAEGIRAVYDEHAPTAPKPCTTGHTYFDYTQLSSSKAKQVAGKLRDRAEARGRKHP